METIETDVDGRRLDEGTMPRSIQSSGFLVALAEDWRVECASANVGAFLGIEARELIGAAASTFFTEDAIHALRNRLALLREPDAIERLYSCALSESGPAFDVAIHVAGKQVIVEAEPSTSKQYGDVSATLRGMMARLEASDFPAFCAAGARQMRALTGFDRVIVTRVLADGSATVIAEAARASIGNLVGTRIPSAAMAAYECAAYRRTPLHGIADVDAEPVAIFGGTTDGVQSPDLGRAVLRSASGGQLDHLRTIGARAALTIGLEVDNVLWGVISCHHTAPRRVTFERRAMAELFAQMFAMRIEIAQLKSAVARGNALLD